MAANVLLVGATGRTGLRTLRQLLQRGAEVRAIVRSPAKLPADLARSPRLKVVEASLLALSDEELQRHLRGCDAVISCLGHVIDLRGIFGPPRDLVARATRRLCQAIEALRPAAPVRFILMSSVSVHRPGPADARRRALERAFLWLLRGLVPPARDNQRAADFLADAVGAGNAFVEWAVVRPDSLLEGEVSSYALHEGLVNTISSPGQTRMANVGHFLCELATEARTWATWKGRLPVITDRSEPSSQAGSRSAA